MKIKIQTQTMIWSRTAKQGLEPLHQLTSNRAFSWSFHSILAITTHNWKNLTNYTHLEVKMNLNFRIKNPSMNLRTQKMKLKPNINLKAWTKLSPKCSLKMAVTIRIEPFKKYRTNPRLKFWIRRQHHQWKTQKPKTQTLNYLSNLALELNSFNLYPASFDFNPWFDVSWTAEMRM